MFLLGGQDLTAIAGSRKIFADVNVGVEDGDRIGILGPNGAGKSTLLRLLAGTQEPDDGAVVRTGGTTIAAVWQHDNLNLEDSVVTAIHGDIPEYEWARDPFNRDIHAGLLRDIDLNARVSELSGGQRRRVAIARALAAKADILCLDEPTNHLDIEAVAWLAQHLQRRFGIQVVRAAAAESAASGFGSAVERHGASPAAASGKNSSGNRTQVRQGSGDAKAATVARAGSGALLVVTHDRWFLDAVCSRIWEVVPGVDPGGDRPQIPGHVETYEGSYAAYVLARAEREHQANVAAQKRENMLRKELAWLRRGAPARTSKPKFRIAAAEALIANEPPPRDSVQLAATASARLGKDVVDLIDVTFGYPGVPILEDATWRLAPGERVGLIGVNGAGKTTVLRLLDGDLQPQSGRVKRGKTVVSAILSQTMKELDAIADDTVVQAVSSVRQSLTIGGKDVTASQLVERLGFTRNRAWTRIRDLSGGEKRRVQLLRLICTEPNLLILDEPTNDLDTDTLAVLEDLLDSFPGTLIVVSHDRYLLERVTDHQVALLGDGQVSALPGGVEQYLQLRAAAERAEDERGGAVRGGAEAAARGGSQPEAAASATSGGADAYKLQKQAQAAERQVNKLQQQAEKLDAQMAQLSENLTPEAIEKLAALNAQRQELGEQIEAAEMRWLELLEAAE